MLVLLHYTTLCTARHDTAWRLSERGRDARMYAAKSGEERRVSQADGRECERRRGLGNCTRRWELGEDIVELALRSAVYCRRRMEAAVMLSDM